MVLCNAPDGTVLMVGVIWQTSYWFDQFIPAMSLASTNGFGFLSAPRVFALKDTISISLTFLIKNKTALTYLKVDPGSPSLVPNVCPLHKKNKSTLLNGTFIMPLFVKR